MYFLLYYTLQNGHKRFESFILQRTLKYKFKFNIPSSISLNIVVITLKRFNYMDMFRMRGSNTRLAEARGYNPEIPKNGVYIYTMFQI